MVEMDTVAVAQVGQKRSRKGGLKKGKANGNCGDGGDQSEHEMHIWTERERRKKMRNMFSSLHALLPQLPAKVKMKKNYGKISISNFHHLHERLFQGKKKNKSNL